MKIGPDSVPVLTALAETQAILGRPTEAIATAERVLTPEHGSAAAHVLMGRVQEQLGRVQDAEAAYHLGVVYARQGRPRRGPAALEAALGGKEFANAEAARKALSELQ